MANLTLSDKELRSRRFLRFVAQSGVSRAQALGMLLFFWDATRSVGLVEADRLALQGFIDGTPETQRAFFDVLVGCGYILPTREAFFAVDGNEEAVAQRMRKRAYAAKGGRAKSVRAAKPRRKAVAPKPAAPSASPEVRTALAQACQDTWLAYASAYKARTTRMPLRNAKTNAQIKQLVQRVGAANAPGLVRFYVEKVTDPYYTKNVWPLGALLNQAEGFVTQWQTGRTFSPNEAQALSASADYYRRQEELAQIAAGLERKGLFG